MAEQRDFYQVLGVSRDADGPEIQRAYRTLARRHHPDVNKDPGAEDRFKEINEAYHVLSDPQRRRKYDRFGSAWSQVSDEYAQAGSRAGAGAGSRRGGYGGRRGYGSARTAGGAGGVGGAVDLEDLLGSLFGERGGFARGGFERGGPGGFGPVQGADTQAEITISVEDAHRGARRRITLPGPDGQPRNYDVNIPAGVVEGQRIRLAGQGGTGAGGGPSGDLYLVVHLAPHPRYRVEGRDIVVDLPVAPWEAVLGATVPLATPSGAVKVAMPPGTSSGRRLRLRGKGLPNPRGTPGDLFATVRIVVPTKTSDEERRRWQELASISSFDPRGAT